MVMDVLVHEFKEEEVHTDLKRTCTWREMSAWIEMRRLDRWEVRNNHLAFGPGINDTTEDCHK